MARMTPRRSQARKIPGTLSTLLFALLVASSVMLSASLAHADEHADARALYQKGNTAFASGDDVMARHHYQKSLEKAESFDTMCNLGRTEARMKLHAEAYEHLRMCVWLYPKDEELAEAKGKFSELRDEVRKELTYEDADVVDDRVDAEIARREEIAVIPAPASGLEEPKPAAEPQRNTWKWPVVISVGAAGVAGAVVGGVFLGKAGKLKREGEALQDPDDNSACAGDPPAAHCSELESTLEKADSTKNAGVGLLAAGGALALGAVVLAIVVPNERATVALGRSNVVLGMPSVMALPTGDFHFGLQGQF